MGRRQRNQSEPLCCHVTHRCHGRDFLLKFRRDRQNYLLRLHEMARRYRVDVLTYMITSNHVHFLLWSDRARAVSNAMHFLQGTVAGDYNRRKKREGAFWRGRYYPTLIESGSHLSRCLFYIDLNMVRAKVCRHPSEWIGGAYAEILGERQRYRIVNRERLRECLGMSEYPESEFTSWYRKTIDDEVCRGYLVREAFWSEALAVGSEAWVESLLPNVRNARIECIDPQGRSAEVSESPGMYAVYAPKREREVFWRNRVR